MQLQWAFPITVETQLHHVWAEAILVSPAVIGGDTSHGGKSG
ncbi:hypothetical protein [Siphonobacter sp. SORGH_AS_1065]|nr:hypothetical protein [Siphonobacter sp. SORGH_AS_1065]MDQ1089872.1 hypothetical protein [Siphonobacter sp. SORGH_AS_1065]